MGFFDTLANLFSNNTKVEQSSGAASSSAQPAKVEAPAQVNSTTQVAASSQPEQQLTAEQQQLGSIMEVTLPVMIQKEVKQSDERRVTQLQRQSQIITDAGAGLTTRVYEELDKKFGANDNLLNANEIMQLAQLEHTGLVDSRINESQKMYREQLGTLNEAINTDLADRKEAQDLQNSGNPLKWIWGRVKEEFNNDTLKENMNFKSNIEAQQTADFNNNLAERQINTARTIDAARKQIIAKALVDKINSRIDITGTQIDFLAKQFDLGHKEMADIYQNMQIDMQKQQLSYQGAYLKLAQAQDARAVKEWNSKTLDKTMAQQAGKDTIAQIRAAMPNGVEFTDAQLMNAWTDPQNVANAPVIRFIQQFQGTQVNDIASAAGAAGAVSYAEVANWGAASIASDSSRFYKQIQNDIAADPAFNQRVNSMINASDTTKQQAYETEFQRRVQDKMSNAQELINNNQVIVPTAQSMAMTTKNMYEYTKKSAEALKSINTTITGNSTSNSKYIEDIVAAATANNVPLQDMAQQVTGYFKQVAAEHFRRKLIPANMTSFNVTIADDYTGSLNSFTGTFNPNKRGVNLMDVRTVNNLLEAARKRQRTQAELAAQQQQLSAYMTNPANIQFGIDMNKPTVNIKEY